MKVELPLMIQDPLTVQRKGMASVSETIKVETEAFYLDGPVTERVAILDFDQKTGQLTARQAKFSPPKDGEAYGRYLLEKIPRSYDQHPDGEEFREFIQVSVLATILQTIQLAEGERVLGRRLRWAFDAPQLLVIPQAGEWANAYYERATHSLQFFYFTPSDGQGTIYTCLSRDIVAHETAHAILDAIVPDIYDALSPQALALHEAFADITAVIMSINSPVLAKTVLDQTGGQLRGSTALSRIAEQFGHERLGKYSLRDISMLQVISAETEVDPHELSTVLSSALYEILISIYEHLDAICQDRVEALTTAAGHLANMIFRGLDYLPPGEISFADYGRAILAADEIAYPENETYRDFLRESFVKRNIAAWEALNAQGNDMHAEEYENRAQQNYGGEGSCATNVKIALSAPINLDDLVNSDWVAYEFANRPIIRQLLAIPDNTPHFRIQPRFRTTKLIGAGEKQTTVSDIIFKASWEVIEENSVGNGLPTRRRFTTGTTLVISSDLGENEEIDRDQSVWAKREKGSVYKTSEYMQSNVGENDLSQNYPGIPYESGMSNIAGSYSYSYTGKGVLHVRALLISDSGIESQRQGRSAMINRLLETGLLEFGAQEPGSSGVQALLRDNVLKVNSTMRMLHIAGDFIQGGDHE